MPSAENRTEPDHARAYQSILAILTKAVDPSAFSTAIVHPTGLASGISVKTHALELAGKMPSVK